MVALLGVSIVGVFSLYTSPPSAVNVFAGFDTYTCINQNLTLSTLNATINGDGVTNGDWITLGDGRFTPSNSTSGRFSTSTTYIPGPNDRTLGYYKLLLIADPSALNPNERVRDEVRITFNAAPPIICSANIFISLNETCTQKVDVTMLNPNPQQPYSQYIISLFDKDGKPIPNQLLTKAHLGQEVSYRLGHECTSNICWGKIQVKDYFPPSMVCANDTIKCTRSVHPDSLGWPFPSTAYIDTIINDNHIVKNWDACSDVTLHYSDEVFKANCLADLDRSIKRIWTATDAYGNTSYCEQWIVIKRVSLSDIVFPSHFDGVINPVFECSDTFPMLANGFPSPDTTGVPTIGSCTHLQFNMTDIPFDLCGKSKKIVRSWFVIDWCTALSRSENQFIYLMDLEPPVIDCNKTLIFGASPYGCYTDRLAIPALLSIYDCNDVTINVSISKVDGSLANQFLIKENNSYFVNKLPLGNYEITYTAKDACNNTSYCTTDLLVEDKIAPFVSCDQLTRITLTDNGTATVLAQTFNDNSIDNCAIADYKVRRMINACGQVSAWRNHVLFCCDDIGTIQMVALEVTDVHGNKNTCMVEVAVDDKLAPTITCPPTLTIECSQSYQINNLAEYGTVQKSSLDIKPIIVNNAYHTGIVGYDGIASDACNFTVTETALENVTCFNGSLVRTFKATDNFGNSSTCTQTIHVRNPRPFAYNDITWPKDTIGTGCRPEDLKPSVTGMPTYINTACATVSAAHEDQVFYIADGACIKIIRTWTVLDWCQYKQVGDPGKFGPYVQIIKINNTDAPYFLIPCKDTTVCSYAANCNGTNFIFDPVAEDACTTIDLLKWTYTLDLGNDGIVDSISSKQGIDFYLPMGKHKVTYTVTDQCGNYNSCSHIVTVNDCKNPTPYCLGSLSTSIDAQTRSATIWAKDFDKGAFDNCTMANDLLFTFSNARPVPTRLNNRHFFRDNGILSDSSAYLAGTAQVWIPETKTSGIYLDCDDIEDGISADVTLNVTVIDEIGNRDSCEVILRLEDHGNVCPDLLTTGTVSGKIATFNGVIPKNVTVGSQSAESNKIASFDNVSGTYVFADLELFKPYDIKPSKQDGLIDGVSTLDLVRIQRHILGFEKLNSPYKIIAADVNQSSTITASDLVELRKIILGITNSFPKQSDPWTFIPSDYVFTDPNIPYFYPKNIEIPSLENTINNANFVAVHLGDVDGTALGGAHENGPSFRQEPIRFISNSIEKNGIWYTALSIDESFDYNGFQMKLIGKNILDVSSDLLQNFHTHITDEGVSIVSHTEQDYRLEPKVTLINIVSSEPIYGLDFKANNEIYDEDLAIHGLSLQKQYSSATSPIHVVTNPVFEQVRLAPVHDDWTALHARMIDVHGRIVANFGKNTIAIEQGEYRLNIPQGLTSQVYQIQLFNQFGQVASLPFILIR
jgi:hypothetical protein